LFLSHPFLTGNFFLQGVVEGNVGSIRFLGVLNRFRGLCIGRRLLSKVEQTIFNLNCIRVVANIPSPRNTLLEWIVNRGYELVKDVPYPFDGLQHYPIETIDRNEVFLVQCVKTNSSSNSATTEVNSTTLATTTTTTTTMENIPPPHPKKKIILPPHWRTSNPIAAHSEDVALLQQLSLTGGNKLYQEQYASTSFDGDLIEID
jgi:hypothetical protein